MNDSFTNGRRLTFTRTYTHTHTHLLANCDRLRPEHQAELQMNLQNVTLIALDMVCLFAWVGAFYKLNCGSLQIKPQHQLAIVVKSRQGP
eukprot:2935139-Amphidinium_carterae.1